MKSTLVLGGPGSGKTHRLLEIIEKEMRDGVLPESIAFVSFTKKAVDEARERAMHKFGMPESRFPLFRTLHSLCFRALGLRKTEVLSRRDYSEIGRLLNIPISGYLESEDGDQANLGDRMLFLDSYARMTISPHRQAWEHSRLDDVSWERFHQFFNTLKAFKEQRGLYDFTDMLERYVSGGSEVGATVAIIDEAQDLTPIQWRVVDLAFSEVARMYMAGDDDQAIYAWSGADIERFLSLSADHIEVLPESHRLPRKVFDFSATIVDKIKRRYAKKWGPRDDEGDVKMIFSLHELDLSQGSWYILVRNRCFSAAVMETCEQLGLPYTSRFGSSIRSEDIVAIRTYERWRSGKANLTNDERKMLQEKYGDISGEMHTLRIWHDQFTKLSPRRRAYYLTALRNGQKLTTPPRIHIDTIHGVKGGQADNVVLIQDQTARTERGSERFPDDEARVFYVGATRAKHRLYIHAPQTTRSYGLRVN